MPIIDTDSPNVAAELEEYENFIATSPHGHMLQSVNWLKVKNNWNADFVYLRDEEGKICAAVTLLSVANDEYSLMYARGPVCDFSDVDLVMRLLEEAKPAIKARNPYLLRLEPEHPFDQELVDKYRAMGFQFRSSAEDNYKPFSNGVYTMIRWINGKSEEEVFADFSSRFRGKIRKSYKSGISSRIYTAADEDYPRALETFHMLVKTSLDRKGAITRPIEYFDRMVRAFPGGKIILTSDEEGTPLAGCLLVNYNNKAHYVYAGSSTEKRNLYPATQTNWEAIKNAIAEGMTHYDMGSVKMHNEGCPLFKFKRDLCGEAGMVQWIGALDLVFEESRYRQFLPEDIRDTDKVTVVKDF